MNKIKKMNSDQIYQLQKDITDEMLNKIQKEYDNSLYSSKLPTDKLICQICGGKYTRSCKSKHDNSNRHATGVREIHESIRSSIYKNRQ